MELVDGQQEGQLEAPPFGLFFSFLLNMSKY